VAERLAERAGFALAERRFSGRFGSGRLACAGGGLELAVLAPQTWMNRSGEAVAAAVTGLALADPAQDLLLVFDDVDLPFGRLRLRPGGGAGGHRGLSDVIEALGRSDLPRLRFGVGRPQEPRDLAEWVLEPFSAEEERRLDERLEAAADAATAGLVDGIAAAMNRVNAAARAEAASGPAGEGS
jgi:PTH1 family peptidyl-tRNA hydrolase